MSPALLALTSDLHDGPLEISTALPVVNLDLHDAPAESSSLLTKKCKCVDCDEDKLCGGLWKGISYPGQASNYNLSQKRVHIIVSHCKTDLHWMHNFTKGYENVATIHVITKCGQEVIGAPDMATIEEMPNVGRCDHSFVRYITSILDEKLSNEKDDDTSIVMFLKDDRSNKNIHHNGKWNDFETMIRVASSWNGFSCGLIHDRMPRSKRFDMSTYYLTNNLLEFNLKEYNRRDDMYGWDGIEFKSDWEDLRSFYRHVLNAEPSSEVVQVCLGGTFATTVSHIKKVDAIVWKAAEQVLQRGDSIEEGHFMERSWAYLLASPLEKYQIDELLRYSYAKHHGSFNGVLFHEIGSLLDRKKSWMYCEEGEKQYKERYPEFRHIHLTKYETAFNHFMQRGRFEGRKYDC